jgi:hypothetical protein
VYCGTIDAGATETVWSHPNEPGTFAALKVAL